MSEGVKWEDAKQRGPLGDFIERQASDEKMLRWQGLVEASNVLWDTREAEVFREAMAGTKLDWEQGGTQGTAENEKLYGVSMQ